MAAQPTCLALLLLLAASTAVGSDAIAPSRAGVETPGVTSSPTQLRRADESMLRDIARVHLAEIAMGRHVLEKSQQRDVRRFAQWMVDDHSSAWLEVEQLARARSVRLPDQPDMKHRSMVQEMQALGEARLDREYILRAGMLDHRQTLKLLQTVQAKAADADLQALAGRTQPMVERHLRHAEQMVRL